MKTSLTADYSFTASTRTLDFSATSGFDVKRLVAVINLTRGVIIYAPSVTGYSSISGGNVLDEAAIAEALQAVAEDVRGDAFGRFDEVLESAAAENEVADDEERPFVAKQVQTARDRTRRAAVGGFCRLGG